MRVLEVLSKGCAVVAGALLTLITLLTCANLIGRNWVGITLAGDFELTAVAAGAAIALFLPWCQYQRGNIIVDFFTSNNSAHNNARLDRLGALLLALVMALMAWRTALGGVNAYSTNSGTMMLGFPEWVVYALIVPPLALTALVALWQAATGAVAETSP